SAERVFIWIRSRTISDLETRLARDSFSISATNVSGNRIVRVFIESYRKTILTLAQYKVLQFTNTVTFLLLVRAASFRRNARSPSHRREELLPNVEVCSLHCI